MESTACTRSSPRPSTSKRVLACKRPAPEEKPGNCFKKLFRRETSHAGNWAFKRHCAEEKFKNYALQAEFDTYDPKLANSQKYEYLKKRSKIVEIASAKDLVFALTHSGACAAMTRDTNQRLCFLNTSPEEVIRSLFYNKNNDSIITVSVYSEDDFSTLRCRTTPLQYIRRGQPDGGFPLFETECLKWPGFVEFDDVNGKVLTYSSVNKIYRVFDLKNYTLLYSVRDQDIAEIKISPGVLLLIFERRGIHIPLKILNVEDGAILKSIQHVLRRMRKVDFIEQFNDKLLVKQELENLQILDIRTGSMVEVSKSEFMTPTAFIFLYENQMFLTFRNRTVGVWNIHGDLVTSFEDHILWYPDSNTSNIYITGDQDLIISYCKMGEDERDGEEEGEGTINISSILTGKLLWKIHSRKGQPGQLPLVHPPARTISGSSVTDALEDVTSLFYNEERNEIYTGNRQGLLHVWTN